MADDNFIGVTLGIALLGAVLGIINTWRSFDRDRIRVKVTPTWSIFQDGQWCLSIEIINLGYVPITISQVGYTLRTKKARYIFLPRLQNGGFLPQRMEPRTSFTAIAPFGAENDEAMRDVRRAFAQTACNRTFTGNSPALRAHVKTSRAAWEQKIEQAREQKA
jgi:hypothetical protein